MYDRSKRLVTSLKHPDWLRVQPSLLFNGCSGLFPWVGGKRQQH